MKVAARVAMTVAEMADTTVVRMVAWLVSKQVETKGGHSAVYWAAWTVELMAAQSASSTVVW